MKSQTKSNDIADNDRSGLFYAFISPELSKAVAALRPSGMTEGDYHVSIMEEFMAANKARKSSPDLRAAAKEAIIKERFMTDFSIDPTDGQTEDELEDSLQQASEARLATVIQAACTHHVEAARKGKTLEPS